MEEKINLSNSKQSSESSANPDIEEIMDKMSDYAQSKGLTKEKLEEILNENLILPLPGNIQPYESA